MAPFFFHSGRLEVLHSIHSGAELGGGGVLAECVELFGGGGAMLGGGGSPSVDAIMLDVRRTVLYSA